MYTLLRAKLKWKTYSFDATTGLLTTEFLGDEYTLQYELTESRTAGLVIEEMKDKIIKSIVVQLLESAMEEEIFSYVHKDGKLARIKYKVEKVEAG